MLHFVLLSPASTCWKCFYVYIYVKATKKKKQCSRCCTAQPYERIGSHIIHLVFLMLSCSLFSVTFSKIFDPWWRWLIGLNCLAIGGPLFAFRKAYDFYVYFRSVCPHSVIYGFLWLCDHIYYFPAILYTPT